VGKKNGPQEQWNAWGNKKARPGSDATTPPLSHGPFLILWFEHTVNFFVFNARTSRFVANYIPYGLNNKQVSLPALVKGKQAKGGMTLSLYSFKG
jgi:hypothetical protein